MVTSECQLDTRKHTVTCRVLSQPTDPRIQLLLGETVHSLRQALDHLAYALAVRIYGVDPPPNERNTGFPIRGPGDTAQEFLASVPSYVGPVKSMPPGMYAALERFQPYNGGNRLLLHALSELDNLDKHRAFPVVAAVAHIPDLYISELTGGVRIGNLIEAETVSDTRIRDHLMLGAFEDGQVLIESGDNMHVYMAVTASVAFDKGFRPAPGELVPLLLLNTRDLIRDEIFPELEAFL